MADSPIWSCQTAAKCRTSIQVARIHAAAAPAEISPSHQP
jgi:hypothetical protein